MGKSNTPSSSSKSMSKFELDEKNKLKAYLKFSTDAKKQISKLEKEKRTLKKT